MELEKQFGQNVRYWRKQRGMSQEDLAERAKIHVTYVSGVETGYRNPTLKVIGRIAEALGVEANTLFSSSISRTSSKNYL